MLPPLRTRRRRKLFRQSLPGLLDQYAGAAAAYSLRALSRAFAYEPIINVRRASDADEVLVKPDPGAGFRITVDSPLVGSTAKFGSFYAGTNAFVADWYDESGNGRDASQAAASAQPQIVSSGSLLVDGNGLAIVRYDGTDDRLLSSSDLTSISSGMVTCVHSTSASAGAMLDSEQGNDYLAIFQDTSTATAIDQNIGNPAYYINNSLPAWADRDASHAAISTGSQQLFSSTGVEFSASPAGTYDTAWFIYSYYTGSSFRQQGDVSEYIIWDNDTNRATIDAIVADYYGITLS